MKRINDNDLINKYIQKYKDYDFYFSKIRQDIQLVLFDKREIICNENDKVKYLLFFVEGKAKVYINLKNGKRLLLTMYKPSYILGDLELVCNERATANVEAIEKTYCLAIPIDVFKKKYLMDSELLQGIGKSLGEKLKRASKNSTVNMLYPLENRLASYMLLMSVPDENQKLVFNENLMEMSELLGSSYRHLLRTLNLLCDKGLIKKKQKYYEIINIDKLKNLSEELYI